MDLSGAAGPPPSSPAQEEKGKDQSTAPAPFKPIITYRCSLQGEESPGAINHLLPPSLPGKISSLLGDFLPLLAVSSFVQPRRAKAIQAFVKISIQWWKKRNKWCCTVWVNCFKFWSIPVGLHRATHRERAQFTVIEWKTQSPFQHYISHAPGWRFNMHA